MFLPSSLLPEFYMLLSSLTNYVYLPLSETDEPTSRFYILNFFSLISAESGSKGNSLSDRSYLSYDGFGIAFIGIVSHGYY